MYMNKKELHSSFFHTMVAIGILFILFATCAGPSLAQIRAGPSPLGKERWLYVGGSGPGNFTTIQDAIDSASEGDQVFVFSGWYNENIIINKSIVLTGEDKNTTSIVGGNGSEIIRIRDCQVELSGFTIQSYNGTNIMGMEIIGCWSSHIHDTIVKSCDIGMLISDTESSRISHNTFLNCHNGLYLGIIGNVTISWNRLEGNGNGSGIECFLSTLFRNYFIRNSISNNVIGMYLAVTSLTVIKENNFIGNQQPAFFTASFFNIWDLNYWGKSSYFPKLIPGRFGLRGIIPIVNFDWHPAQEPYDI